MGQKIVDTTEATNSIIRRELSMIILTFPDL